MARKLGIAAIILGLAALSPAPIKDVHAKRPHQAPHSQAQLEKEQQYNGVVPVVGQVPQYVDEVGRERQHKGTLNLDHSGDQSLVVGSATSDKIAGESALKQANVRVESGGEPERAPWVYGVILVLAGFLGWRAIQYKIDKSMPVPEFSRRFLKEIDGKH